MVASCKRCVFLVLVDEHHSQSAFLRADAVLRSDSSVCVVRRDALKGLFARCSSVMEGVCHAK